MTTTIETTRELMQEFYHALLGKPKDSALIDKYVADRELKQHILETEAAFPQYTLKVHQLIAEGNIAAANVTFSGVHKGAFAGIEPTGKTVTAGAMIFYQVENGKIQKFWIQMDLPAMLAQLQA